MKKQKSVQAQNSELKRCIKTCALEFRENLDFPRALLDCFEALGIDFSRDILTEHDRMPDGGPTEAYRGTWLTHNFQFIGYEIYLDIKNEYLVEIDVWKNLTDQIEINPRKAGIGKSCGWISIEVLEELNA